MCKSTCCVKTPVAPKTPAKASKCKSDGTWYMPLNMKGQGRTVASVAGCKQRCVDT